MKENIDLAQLRLSNGSEILCEVMEWPPENENQLIMRNAMSIICYEMEEGDTTYAFRPFIHFLDDDKDYVCLNTDHVLSVNRPTEYLVEQYGIAVTESLMNAERRNMTMKRNRLEQLSRLAEAMEQVAINSSGNSSESDSDYDPFANVIPFPSRDDILH